MDAADVVNRKKDLHGVGEGAGVFSPVGPDSGVFLAGGGI